MSCCLLYFKLNHQLTKSLNKFSREVLKYKVNENNNINQYFKLNISGKITKTNFTLYSFKSSLLQNLL